MLPLDLFAAHAALSRLILNKHLQFLHVSLDILLYIIFSVLYIVDLPHAG